MEPQGRRARLPEGEGRRQVSRRATASPGDAYASRSGRPRRLADRRRRRRSRAMARRVDARARRHRATRRGARGRRRCRDRRSRRCTDSTPRSAPTPARRSLPTSARATRSTRCVPAPSASDRRWPEDRVRAMMFARAAGMAQGGSGDLRCRVPGARRRAESTRLARRVPSFGSIGVADLPQLSHIALALVGEGEARDRRRARSRRREALARGRPLARRARPQGRPRAGQRRTPRRSVTRVSRPRTTRAPLDRCTTTSSRSRSKAFARTLAARRARAGRAARAGPGGGRARIAKRSRAARSEARRGAARPGSAVVPLRGAGARRRARRARARDRACRDRAQRRRRQPARRRRRRPAAVDRQFPRAGPRARARGAGARRRAGRDARRRALHADAAPATSGLPLQLTRHGPQQSGFATVQKTLTALANDIRHLANPACLDFLPVSESVEDHAPMAPRSVAKLGEMRERLRSSGRDRGDDRCAGGRSAAARRALDAGRGRPQDVRRRCARARVPRRRSPARAGHRAVAAWLRTAHERRWTPRACE